VLDSASAARHREREALRIMFAGFLVFCLCLVGIPLGIRYFLNAAMSARPARVEVIRGTVLFLPNGSRHEVSASNGMELREGDQIRVAPDSLAMIQFPDGSNVQVYSDTALRLERARWSTYNANQSEVVLSQLSGQSRVEVAPPTTDSRQFELRAGESSARLREGSYGARVSGTANSTILDLSVRRGSASVSTADRFVEVLPGESTTAMTGEPPAVPRSATRNFVDNGDFAGALADWQAGNRSVEDGNPGDISVFEQDGRSIVRFVRRDSNSHAETYLHQNIDQDVSDLQSLAFGLQLKIVNQSLEGGGWLGSEYPVTIRIHYRDAGGSETTWVQGFYVQNAEGRPTTNGQLVAKDTWVSFAANLFDPNRVYPRPARLLWVEVEAAGWQYESMVTGVQILGD
jgi:hypothetical protein